jgi:hypothetical protein
MGKGIDLARPAAPEHTALLDEMKDQLLLVLVNRLGGKVEIPVKEIDDIGDYLMYMQVVDGTFVFETGKKQ